jgi:hypothetical protein
MKTAAFVIAVAAFLATGPVAGANLDGEIADELVLCTQHRDDAARLACFDRMARSATAALEAGTSLGARARTPAAATEQAPANAAAPTPPAGTEATAAAAPAQEAGFGLEQQRSRTSERTKSIRSRIPGEFFGWDGKTIFELENGQVWRQLDSSRLGMRVVDAEVEISRGILGSFYLSVEGFNRRVRVERIE